MAWQVPWFIALIVNFVPWIDSPSAPLLIIPSDVPLDAESTVSVNLTIANHCVMPDGVTRFGVLAEKDGMKNLNPSGPIISGYQGDRFLINVINQLDYTETWTGVTVHWHGIFQNHSSQMDGVAFVTQCPILPGESFLYNFTVPNQAGTFWYHSHYATQYCDGLRGPLIIRDRDDPYRGQLYDIDDDSTVITLMDWYHYPSVVTPRQIWPDSALINGTGCYQGSDECPQSPIYQVEAGNRYRFRLLNMACKSWFDFKIEGHVLELIEIDGTMIDPVNVTTIRAFAAQRYSFVPYPIESGIDFTIQAFTNLTNANDETVKTQTVTATLQYDSMVNPVSESAPESMEEPQEPLFASMDIDPGLLGEPDILLSVTVEKTANFNFSINGVQYIPPDIPLLLQIMSGNPIPPSDSTYSLQRNKLVEITFYVANAPGHPHAFHLHGHNFLVTTNAPSDVPSLSYTMRDTVNTGMPTDSDTNVTIRFRTDNPGPWFLHCHTEWHLWTGMGMLFIEDYDGIIQQEVNEQTKNQCPYTNPSESSFTFPATRTTPGAYYPQETYTCNYQP